MSGRPTKATMHTAPDKSRVDRIGEIARHARAQMGAGPAAPIVAFLETLYAGVSADELAERSVGDHFGAARSLWDLATLRRPGQALVRAVNPAGAAHGWDSPHTVVQIVNDDMPFLVDSVTAELNRRELTVHDVIHPTIRVARAADGTLTGLAADGVRESVMHIEIDELPEASLAELETSLRRVLADVRVAVGDWKTMISRVDETIASLTTRRPPVDPSETAAAIAFLEWVRADNFTFLGYREARFEGEGETARADVQADRSLGICRDDAFIIFRGLRKMGSLPPDVQLFLRSKHLISIMKANSKSTVHRSVHLDAVVLKDFDDAGRVCGQRVFVGLFTSVAYSQSPRSIPLLKEKVESVAAHAGYAPASHNAKALWHVLETFPRDELFQVGEDELLATALGILRLHERQRTAAFVRKDPFERYVSVLVFTPRERYDAPLRRRFEAILCETFHGEISTSHSEFADDTVLVRVHFIVRTKSGEIPPFDLSVLNRRLAEAARGYADRLRDALVASAGEEKGLALARRYADAFPAAWREHVPADAAVGDIARIEAALAGPDAPVLHLHRPDGAAPNELCLRIYRKGEPVALSDVLPMLENMGLRGLSETPYKVTPAGADPVWVHDFGLSVAAMATVDVPSVKASFEETLTRVWTGAAENDRFNRLVLIAGLAPREVDVLRAYARYLRQAGIGFSQVYMQDALAAQPKITRRLVDLFLAQHDPSPAARAAADSRAAVLVGEITQLLEQVANLDEDRILRRFLNVVSSTLRTNYFQPGADGQPKPYISFKLDSRALDELPLPRPLVEIWIYSPAVEAVHLRGGRVARGGLRWSDRREDFRTEILGLMKAQMVKNTVIVPVGSKGGFFVKRPPPASAGREAQLAEGIACYKTMMRGLLDITDTRSVDGVVPPKSVVRRDGDDPYLVVAADKGTATFSDIANGVSREYGFWIDDAFASGGSAGYDHKVMGITARGAWEAVKRHFREMGIDCQTTDFTCVGVGDMSGDVFGNGLLRSKHTKLLAAFDHRHIFLDPNPDPAVSFEERQRLFDLPRSTWDDYDKSKLSAGGGVFPRTAKSIKLSTEVRRTLGIDAESCTPFDLIRAILKANVDLLWLGGIGTYVKASTETHTEVGDRASDPVRIDGREVRARVVAEGANLGFTLRGRVEYAQSGANGEGGRINTDAIDNSAGVDTSDHEVNIKLLFGDVVARGEMTMAQRDVLLAEMTEEVGEHVLRDNYLQTQALSMLEAEGAAGVDSARRIMHAFEKAGRLNRAVEFLPSDEELAKRKAAGKGLTRPELAVLLAYAKLGLYDDLLASDVCDDPALVPELVAYFPTLLQRTQRAAIDRHRLRREIIATVVTNALVNRMGPWFVEDTREATGRSPADIARAWIVARDAFGLPAVWAAIEAGDNRMPAKSQTAMLRECARLAGRAVPWILRQAGERVDVTGTVAARAPGLAELARTLPVALDPERAHALAERRAVLEADGVPAELAATVAALGPLASGFDIVRLAQTALGSAGAAPVDGVAKVYFAVGARLGLGWLRDAATRVRADTNWQRLAVGAIVDDLFQQHAEIVRRALEAAGSVDRVPAIAAEWSDRNCAGLTRIDGLIEELKATPAIDVAALAVAGRELRALTARWASERPRTHARPRGRGSRRPSP